jgi:hypothetical protein
MAPSSLQLKTSIPEYQSIVLASVRLQHLKQLNSLEQMSLLSQHMHTRPVTDFTIRLPSSLSIMLMSVENFTTPDSYCSQTRKEVQMVPPSITQFSGSIAPSCRCSQQNAQRI